MSAAEVDAILAREKGDASSPLTAYDAQPKGTITYPYVANYFDAGIRFSDREADIRESRTIGWQTTVVGTSADQCRDALDRLTARLEDWRPVVAGRVCSKVEHESSQPVRPDEDLPDRSLFIATDQWRVVSDPA